MNLFKPRSVLSLRDRFDKADAAYQSAISDVRDDLADYTAGLHAQIETLTIELGQAKNLSYDLPRNNF